MASKYDGRGLPPNQGFYWKRDTIYVAFWHDGKKHVFSTGTSKVEEARAFKMAKIRDLQDATDTKVKRGVRMKELFDDYVADIKRREDDAGVYMSNPHDTPSYKTQIQIRKHLEPFFGDLKPEQVTTEKLREYRDLRALQNTSVRTRNIELGYVRRALTLGSEITPRKVNPAQIPSFKGIINTKKENKRTGIITDEQYEALMNVASDHFKPVLTMAIHTGVRAKELKFIRPEQVDFDAHQIHLRRGETKNGEPRIEPINDHVKAVLLEWWEKSKIEFPETEWFFHHQGRQVKNWKTTWNSTLRRAGLRIQKDGKWVNLVKFHDTRRTAATNNHRAGVDVADSQQMLGHNVVAMTNEYINKQVAAERVRHQQNEALRQKAAVKQTAPTPAPIPNDFKAQLKELKELLDGGLLPEDVYRAEVAKVMASR